MAENDDSLILFQSNAGTKRARTSNKQLRGPRRSRKEEFSVTPREPLVQSSVLNQASATQLNPAKRPRIEEFSKKLSEHLTYQTTAAQPTLTHKPPVDRPIPLAYFVDVCLPDPATPQTTIDFDNPPRTYYGHLPFDILGDIFMLCLPSDISRRTKRQEAPLILCRVCRHWRRVALNLSILWNAFFAIQKQGRRLFHQKLLHLYLDRSRTRPLTFAISGPAENRFMEVLMSRVERWKEVTVVIGHSARFAELFLSVTSTPLLEALTIDAVTCEDPIILERLPGVMSKMAQLRRLTWRSKKMSSTFLLAPLRQLTHLDIWCPLTMQDCLSILTQCPRLITLKLDLKAMSNPVPSSTSLITIPTLTHIDVIIYCELADFLHHFHLPALRFIRVMHRRLFIPDFIGLEDFCTRSGCTLETFWINDRRLISSSVIKYLSLPCLQSIRELHIFAQGVNDDFMKALMLPDAYSHRNQPLLLPRLKKLIVGRCISTDGLFGKMVASRCTSDEGQEAGTAFEMVRALFRKGKGKGNRHTEDILDLKAISKNKVRASWGWR